VVITDRTPTTHAMPDSYELYLRESLPVEVNDDRYLLVVPTTAFVGLDEVSGAIVDHLARHPVATAQGLTAELGPGFAEGAVAEGLSDLLGLGVVAPMPNELNQAPAPGPMMNGDGHGSIGRHQPMPDRRFDTRELPMTKLTCHVALDCNLRCTYCYADTGRYGGSRTMMCEGTARDYVDLLIRSSGESRSIGLTFFGGEPLLNWPVMRATILYGEAEARKAGKRISFAVTTNGTLLDREKIDFIAEHAIQVTVSMDGPPAENDRFRILADGQGSYETVVRKVTPLLERHPVTCRMTLTRRTVDVPRLVDHMLDLGFREAGVGVVSSPDPLMNLAEDDLPVLLDGFRVCSERYIEAALRGGFYGFSNLTTLLVQIHEGAAKSFGCGAGVQLFSADPHGDLYSCHRLVGNDRYRIGTLQGGIDREAQARHLDEVHMRHKADCQTCWARHLCGGGCFYQLEQQYEGDLRRAYLPFCDWIRAWWVEGLHAYSRIITGNPTFIERVVEPQLASVTPAKVTERNSTL
jgi:uncharacterized protein